MKRIALLLAVFVTLGAGLAFAANSYEDDFRWKENWAQSVKTANKSLQIRMDYGVRTDGQPIYLGYAIRGKATSDDAWIIYKHTYDVNDQLTLRQTAFDAWDNIATATYE